MQAKKRQALQADAAKCAKLTDMFAAGHSAPMGNDGGGGHREEVVERERYEGKCEGRIEGAVSKS